MRDPLNLDELSPAITGPAFPKPLPRAKEKPRGLQRTRMEKKLPRRLEDPDDDPAFNRFVAMLDCAAKRLAGATRCRGEVQSAHVTLSADQKGMGMKVPGRQRVPLCAHHHDCWDGRVRQADSMFFGWDKPRRYKQAADWVEETNLAATPTADDRESALALADLGLGRIVDGEGGRWTWAPGPVKDEDLAAAALEVDQLTPGSPPIAETESDS